jgi:hypothetical protein
VVDIRGNKDNMCATKKTLNKFCTRFPESALSCQDSINIKRLKKNHLETQTNAQNNKRQNLPIKTAAVSKIVLPPPLNMSRIFAIFLFR